MASSNEADDFFFKLLQKHQSKNCEELLHKLVDTFCGQNAPSYEKYSDSWSLFEWWDLIQTSKVFFKTVGDVGCDVPTYISPLPQEYQNIVTKCLNIRSEDIKDALLEKSHNVSGAYLKNFDWKLQFTVASDKLSQINEPNLLLSLNIEDHGESVPLHLDLSKEELKSFISTLEKANKEITDLKI